MTDGTAEVKAQSKRVARWRRRRREGTVSVTLDVPAERILRLIVMGLLPVDFDRRPLAEKKELLQRALEG